MLKTVEYEPENSLGCVQTSFFEDLLPKCIICYMFHALGPIPLDSQRISDEFGRWKCGKAQAMSQIHAHGLAVL